MFKAVVFDMDGVLRIGAQAVPGANETLQALSAAQIPFSVCTNECRYTPQHLRELLYSLGIHLPPETHIYTAGLAVRDFIERKLQRFSSKQFILGIVGEQGLLDVITPLCEQYSNLIIADRPPPAAPDATLFLVIGTVDMITIEHLQRIRCWTHAGAFVITSCRDTADPSSHGNEIGLGMPRWLLRMANTGSSKAKCKAYSVGKPHPLHSDAILRSFPGIQAREILFVGDTLYTDIRLAEESGFRSALVLTGNTKRSQLQDSIVQPDYVIDSVKDILTKVLNLNR